MLVVFVVDIARIFVVVPVWLKKHHTTPSVHHPPLLHEVQPLMGNSLLALWDFKRWVFNDVAIVGVCFLQLIFDLLPLLLIYVFQESLLFKLLLLFHS